MRELDEELMNVPAEFRRMLFEGCEIPVEEDRGLGRNILKKFGTRAEDDDFEDAVNAANKKNQKGVLAYLNRAVDKALGQKKRYYWLRIDALDELIRSFAKWEGKNSKRYGEFFKMAKAELERMEGVKAEFKADREKFNPKKQFPSNWQQAVHILAEAARAAVRCAKSEYVHDNDELVEKIIADVFHLGVTAMEQHAYNTPDDVFKQDKDFMKLWRSSEFSRIIKNSDNRDTRELAYYMEHDRPVSAGKLEKSELTNGRFSTGGASFS